MQCTSPSSPPLVSLPDPASPERHERAHLLSPVALSWPTALATHGHHHVRSPAQDLPVAPASPWQPVTPGAHTPLRTEQGAWVSPSQRPLAGAFGPLPQVPQPSSPRPERPILWAPRPRYAVLPPVPHEAATFPASPWWSPLSVAAWEAGAAAGAFEFEYYSEGSASQAGSSPAGTSPLLAEGAISPLRLGSPAPIGLLPAHGSPRRQAAPPWLSSPEGSGRSPGAEPPAASRSPRALAAPASPGVLGLASLQLDSPPHSAFRL